MPDPRQSDNPTSDNSLQNPGSEQVEEQVGAQPISSEESADIGEAGDVGGASSPTEPVYASINRDSRRRGDKNMELSYGEGYAPPVPEKRGIGSSADEDVHSSDQGASLPQWGDVQDLVGAHGVDVDTGADSDVEEQHIYNMPEEDLLQDIRGASGLLQTGDMQDLGAHGVDIDASADEEHIYDYIPEGGLLGAAEDASGMGYDDHQDESDIYYDFDDEIQEEDVVLDRYDNFTLPSGANAMAYDPKNSKWPSVRIALLAGEKLDEKVFVSSGPIYDIAQKIIRNNGNLSNSEVASCVKLIMKSQRKIGDLINEPIHVVTPDGRESIMPLLHLAYAYNVSDNLISSIVDAGGNYNIVDGNRATALHYATAYCSCEKINQCADRTDPSLLNLKDFFYRAPIHYLGKNPECSVDNVNKLASLGVDFGILDNRDTPYADGPNASDRASRAQGGGTAKSALHYFAEHNSPEVVNSVLNYLDSTELKDLCTGRDLLGRDVLHFAVENSKFNDSDIKSLIDRGFDPNSIDVHGRTPLHCAVNADNDNIVRALISDCGADVNKADSEGYTALHYAAARSSEETFNSVFLQDGVDIYASDNKGKVNPYHIAIANSQLRNAKVMCPLKIKPIVPGYGKLIRDRSIRLLASKDLYGNTPLHVACMKGSAKTVDYVLRAMTKYHGISVVSQALQQENTYVSTPDLRILQESDVLNLQVRDVTDALYKPLSPLSPLLKAVQHSNLPGLKAALEYVQKDLLYGKCSAGVSSVYIAALSGDKEMLQFVANKAPKDVVNAPDENGVTPLHLAVVRNDSALIKALLSNKYVDINQPMGTGKNTVLHVVSARGYATNVKRLLDYPGIDVHASDVKGNTALHFAVQSGEPKIVKALCNRGLDVNVHNSSGGTPLSYLIENGKVGQKTVFTMANLLLNKGANPNLGKTSKGRSVLTECVSKGYNKVLDVLIDKGGAGITYTDDQSAIVAAVESENTYAVGRLAEIGGDVNHIVSTQGNNYGKSLFMMAIERSDYNTSSLLLDKKCSLIASQRNGDLASHMLARHGDKVFVRKILNRIKSEEGFSASLTIKNANGDTPLHLALKERNADFTKTVGEVCGKDQLSDLLSQQDANNNTPLHVAVAMYDIKSLDMLCRKVNPSDLVRVLNTQNGNGDTPLSLAVRNGERNLVKLLTSKLSRDELSSLVCEKAEGGDTLLHLAIRKGNPDIAKLLAGVGKRNLSRMVSVAGSSGDTLLHLALKERNVDFIKTVGEVCNKDQLSGILSQKDRDGNTPLHVAVAMSDTEALVTLCKKVNPSDLVRVLNTQNDNGDTPLSLAVRNGERNLVELLTSKLSKEDLFSLVCEKDEDGDTLLHLAIRKGNPDIVKLLANIGKKNLSRMVSVVGSGGDTPLHLACQSGNARIADMLLVGVSKESLELAVNSRNSKGNTPAHEAALQDMECLNVMNSICNGYTLTWPNNDGLLVSQCIPKVGRLACYNKLPDLSIKDMVQMSEMEAKNRSMPFMKEHRKTLRDKCRDIVRGMRGMFSRAPSLVPDQGGVVSSSELLQDGAISNDGEGYMSDVSSITTSTPSVSSRSSSSESLRLSSSSSEELTCDGGVDRAVRDIAGGLSGVSLSAEEGEVSLPSTSQGAVKKSSCRGK